MMEKFLRFLHRIEMFLQKRNEKIWGVSDD